MLSEVKFCGEKNNHKMYMKNKQDTSINPYDLKNVYLGFAESLWKFT